MGKTCIDNRCVVVYGSGGYGRYILPQVKSKYPEKTFFYTDGNPSLWGTDIDGIPVMSPESALKEKDVFVVIASVQGFRNIRKRLLDEFGIPETSIDDSFSKDMYERTFGVRNEFLRFFANIVYRQKLKGNCAEGGVFEGDFSAVINRCFPDRKLYLFDTFSGFDARNLQKESNFTSTRTEGFNIEQFTEEKLLSKMEHPENIIIRKGFFPETAAGLSDEFIFVNLDFDLYEPTLSGLNFFYPKMKKGGVILVHDYFASELSKGYAFDKVRPAVDEFCSSNGISSCPIGDRLSIAITK